MKYAQVLADVPFLHTDHPYDYEIPMRFRTELHEGMRVKVNFGGRKIIGFVIGLSDSTTHKSAGEILEIIDTFAVLTKEVQTFCSELARRYLTARSQVFGFAVPKAMARINQKLLSELPEPLRQFEADALEPLALSTSYLVPPSRSVLEWSVDKVAQLIESNRKGIILLPNVSLVEQFEIQLRNKVPEAKIGRMMSDQTPSVRYEQFMRILRGEVHVTIGTRSAVFAPVDDFDYILMMFENDDSFAEQQSGQWHARDAALLRADLAKKPLVTVGYSRSVELQKLVEDGKVQHVVIEGVRGAKTMIIPRDDNPNTHKLRLPSVAFNIIRQGLQRGPVLLQVPLRGYQLNIQCARCRERASCSECGGGLENTPKVGIRCTRCGRSFGQFLCQWCSHSEIRSISVGSVRTAEEIGRAFPNTQVITSGRESIVAEIDAQPSLVIATPGAEPVVHSGRYSAMIILDPEITLNRIDLRAHEEAFRRWYDTKSLVDPEGVQLVCLRDVHQVVQFMIQDNPAGFAHQQLQERIAASLPPAQETYLIEGDLSNIQTALHNASEIPGVSILGPAEHKHGFYALVYCEPSQGSSLNLHLRAILAKRSSTKAKGVLRIHYSPQVLP
ncbi:MAG: hypothetical protein RIS09_732 [Actinomycetota bacterium]